MVFNMITPIRFSANYAKGDEEVLEIPSWVNEPYRLKRQQKLQRQPVEDVYVKTYPNKKSTRRNDAYYAKRNELAIKQLAAIGIATMAMIGAVIIPTAVKSGDKKEETSSSNIISEAYNESFEPVEEYLAKAPEVPEPAVEVMPIESIKDEISNVEEPSEGTIESSEMIDEISENYKTSDETETIESSETTASELEESSQETIESSEMIDETSDEIDSEINNQTYNIPDFEINLSQEQANSLEAFLDNWNNNRDIYEQTSQLTNVPAELIAAIHWRESTGDFGACLHNGADIGNTIDTHEGPKVFYSWQDSAIDALTNYGGNPDDIIENDFQSYCDYAEHYNGMGYSLYQNMNSPYVWAGTDKYTNGKYVQDGHFDPNAKDKQIGVAVMLKALLDA